MDSRPGAANASQVVTIYDADRVIGTAQVLYGTWSMTLENLSPRPYQFQVRISDKASAPHNLTVLVPPVDYVNFEDGTWGGWTTGAAQALTYSVVPDANRYGSVRSEFYSNDGYIFTILRKYIAIGVEGSYTFKVRARSATSVSNYFTVSVGQNFHQFDLRADWQNFECVFPMTAGTQPWQIDVVFLKGVSRFDIDDIAISKVE